MRQARWPLGAESCLILPTHTLEWDRRYAGQSEYGSQPGDLSRFDDQRWHSLPHAPRGNTDVGLTGHDPMLACSVGKLVSWPGGQGMMATDSPWRCPVTMSAFLDDRDHLGVRNLSRAGLAPRSSFPVSFLHFHFSVLLAPNFLLMSLPFPPFLHEQHEAQLVTGIDPGDS